MPGINYANVWTINQSKSLPGFRLATLTDGVKRPVYSDVAERRKRFEFRLLWLVFLCPVEVWRPVAAGWVLLSYGVRRTVDVWFFSDRVRRLVETGLHLLVHLRRLCKHGVYGLFGHAVGSRPGCITLLGCFVHWRPGCFSLYTSRRRGRHSISGLFVPAVRWRPGCFTLLGCCSQYRCRQWSFHLFIPGCRRTILVVSWTESLWLVNLNILQISFPP